MQCSYLDAGLCRSCTRMGVPHAEQVADKERRCRELLGDVPGLVWLPPVAGPEAAYRNKAKMVVGGTVEAPTLGILDADGHGVDLRACGICSDGLRDALPVLAGFVTRAGLTPYDVPTRTGELKHVLVTESPEGRLLVRWVLRSSEPVPRIRKHLPALQAGLPRLEVVTVNLQPAHAAVLEGERELVLTDAGTLPMRLDLGGGTRLDLHLPPQSFFQTNTAVAATLYAQARAWADEVDPATVWDLYCGVGGFALALAAPGRTVLGVETSAEAVGGARRSAHEAGVADVRFEAGDATRLVLDALRGTGSGTRSGSGSGTDLGPPPDLVVVNPPRRGIGPLAGWLEASGVRRVLYSSCSAASLARDLEQMPSLRPVRGRLFDMFPQTRHHELLVLLER